MSFVKPIGSPEALVRYEKGIAVSRLPMLITPDSLILASVSADWANATVAANVAANVAASNIMRE
jgi:hypothetical protein